MLFDLTTYNEEYYRIYERRREVGWDSIPSFVWIRERLDIKDGDCILDAGCGDGKMLDFLCLGKKVKGVGIDMSEIAVSLAKRHFPRYEYHVGSLENLPFEMKTFNKIVCFNVMEHLHNQCLAMKEFQRVLCTDGAIVLGTNIRDSFCWWLYQKIIGEHTHTREFNKKEFCQFAATYFNIEDHAVSSGVFRAPQPFRWVFHHFLKGDILIKGAPLS